MNALDHVVLDKKIFQCFPYISLCKTCDHVNHGPQGQGHNLNKLGRGPQAYATYTCTKYQG